MSTLRPSGTRRPARTLGRDALLATACALVALWTQRRALGVYFHPDDLISLEWTRGILPSPDFGLWRLLSGKVYFAAALGVFGTDPFPYHVLNMLLHMTNVVLLYALARRWGATAASATLAAGLFGSARPAFSVLQQAVGLGELLALGSSLAAMLACERRTRGARLAAIALFAAALLSKEAVLLLPLVLLIPREPGRWRLPAAWRERWFVAAPLLLTSAAAAVTLAVGDVRDRAFGGEAYAMAFGANVFHNLMTYVSWAVDLRHPFFDDPGGISLVAWRMGLPALVLLLGLAWLTRTRTRLPLIGLAWAALTLAPVLPLTHHTYSTYLYAPLAGLAIAVGSGLVTLVAIVLERRAPRSARERSRRVVSRARPELVTAAFVVVGVVAYAIASDRLLEARVSRRLEGVDLPFDRQLRKSEMIRRAAEGLHRTGSPRRIVLYLPVETATRLDQRTGVLTSDTTLAMDQILLFRVLDGGRALRALSPGLDSVAFASRWSSDYASFDLCGNTPAGDIFDFGSGPEAPMRLGARLIESGKPGLAENLLAPASAAYPEDARLKQLLDQARTARAAR